MFYRLAMKASNDTAQAFQAKVADEILPAIRKFGVYATPAMAEKILNDPDIMIRILQELKAERAKSQALSAQVAELLPKADYCEKILQSNEALPVTVIAKDYGMSALAFNQLLNKLQIQFKVGNIWVLRQPYASLGYMKSITSWLGDNCSVTHNQWTQKGRMFLYSHLRQAGILPLIERHDFYPMDNLF